MKDDLQLARHFVSELLARRYGYDRQPEADAAMVDPEGVRQYQRATQAEGNGASAHLFNQLALSSVIGPGQRVVDLACGPASLLNDLASLHPDTEFIGVDLSQPMLELAEQARLGRGLGNVRFELADITRLGFLPGRSVDVVMSTLSMHHLPTEELLDACFAEVARVVKPTGTVYLFDFASFKRQATADYFVHQRTKDLEPYVAADYASSLRAAFRLETFQRLLPRLQRANPAVALRSTYGVPFFVALTNIAQARLPDAGHCRSALAAYWGRMGARQRKDFRDLRRFFAWGGLSVPSL